MTTNQLQQSGSRIATTHEPGAAPAPARALAAFAEVRQDAVPGAVHALYGGTQAAGAGAVPAPELDGAGFTYRHDWGVRHGQWVLRLNWSAVGAQSRVLVSVAEGEQGGVDAGKFVGSARFTVHNVAPRAGGVDIWVNIEWPDDIALYVDYLIVNP